MATALNLKPMERKRMDRFRDCRSRSSCLNDETLPLEMAGQVDWNQQT